MTLSVIWTELLGTRLKVRSILHPDTETGFFRNRQNEFKGFFSQENDLVFCNDVCSVIEALGQHDSTERCLIIGSSNVSLKVVLLHNGNQFPPVTKVNDADTKESHENMKLLLKRSGKKKIIETFLEN
jgi:hypothetical protein